MILNLNSQIIWVFVDLLILFVLMKKFLFGPITQMLDDRAQQVSDTLDQADKRLAEAEQQQTAHAAQLASAKQEAAQIIEEARARGQRSTIVLSQRRRPLCSGSMSRLPAVGNPSGRRCSVRRKRKLPLSFC